MMSGGNQINDSRRARYHLGIQNVVVYCACFSLFFVIVSILVEVPISTMMITQTRKNIGVVIFVCAISFFAVFSFKTSRSSVCFLPLFFVIVLICCPVFLLSQESRHGFNSVTIPSDALPYCPKNMSKRSLPKINPNKYVVFQPTNTGTGNRILALVSAYALSLVTGRQLLVDWQISSVFKAQFSSLFESNIIKPLSSVVFTNQSMNEDDYHFLNLVYCRQCSLRLRHPNFVLLASENLNKEFTKTFIIVRSNVYFAPDLMANVHHREAMCSEFEPKHLFSSLFNRLLKLSPDLESELNHTLDTIENRDIIGIQVRLKDRVGFPKQKVGSFFNCANYISTKYEDPLFFIASDSEELKRKAKLFFGDKLLKFTRKPREFSEKGIQAAVLDLMMLSKC
ncbi:hypothetical protein TRFO_05747 [Tritrichomonas foetus]|uniref:Uncharacterized protein n=1 Tax=Tritrichomonas foetus TaxID=1144522 RepID=A0A1J4K8P5_9EUKA|nr:hypothetical protein TRFO_05747 [Tritrichomonas foetus]|eukprot:OHT06084.1 hypothetical protein TRFO_05747 [Tritrichomonas foetus]